MDIQVHHVSLLQRRTVVSRLAQAYPSPMDKTKTLWRSLEPFSLRREASTATRNAPWLCPRCLRESQNRPLRFVKQQRRSQSNPADDPGFRSVVDSPPVLVRSGRRHKPLGLLVLATIPVTAFALGCWQVKRLGEKTELIAKYEDRLIRDPLPLPPIVDPDAVPEFDYRRVVASGRFRHDKEMLIGPRIHDGKNGYIVFTPLERETGSPKTRECTSILVCRGWIPKSKAAQSSRPEGLPVGEVQVEGLLREPLKKNMFTPDNKPEEGNWYFPDVNQMAAHSGSQPIWIEETMQPDLLISYDRESKGVPIGRPAEVNLRNSHVQYIFTWFSLSAATSVMLWMLVKKPPKGTRVRQSRSW